MFPRLLAATALFVVAGCTGPVGPAGPAGTEGPTGNEGVAGPGYDAPVSISAVVPRSLAVGLTADVTISGYATKWTDQSVVSFGAGVSVRAVKAASSSAMLATIDVSPTAAPGPRDVTVREGTTTTTFKGFEVLPYASLSLVGTPIQGGLVRAHLVVNDPMFVFPASTTFNAGSGVGLVRVEKQRSRSADVLLGVNLDAAPGARTVSFVTGPPSGLVAEALDLEPGDVVHAVTRLRTADGVPMAVERVHLIAALAPELSRSDLESQSLYAYLAQQHGIVMDGGMETIRAKNATAEHARLLQVAPRDAILSLTRTSTWHGRVVEYTVSSYRGDRYELSAAI